MNGFFWGQEETLGRPGRFMVGPLKSEKMFPDGIKPRTFSAQDLYLHHCSTVVLKHCVLSCHLKLRTMFLLVSNQEHTDRKPCILTPALEEKKRKK